MPTYGPPSISLVSQGSQTLLIGGLPTKTVLLLGTAPKGPLNPVLVSPGQLAAMYGDATTPSTTGFTIPLMGLIAAAQRQPASNSPYNFLVCRVGVTPATIAVPDQTGSPKVAFNLYGIGPYSGSAGNYITTAGLNVQITVVSTVVTQILILSGTTVLQTFNGAQYDLTTNQKIVAAINGANPLSNPASVIQATFGAIAALPASDPTALAPKQTTTNLQLTAGADGLGTGQGDATVAAQLAASLNFNVDYIVAGFDANLVASTISTHLTAAAGVNQFRKAILGPKLGITFAVLAASYNNMNSSRVVCIGHDGAYATNPATGGQIILDGYYLAAAYCGLKATGPTEETGTGFAIAGFNGLALPSDKTAPLAQADLNTLGAAGFLVFEQRPTSALLTIRDAITTAPYSATANSNAVNPFSQFNVQDIDDAVSAALVAAVSPFKGRPPDLLARQITQIQAACISGLGRLGTTINGVNSVVVTIDPATLIYTVNVSYITRYPILQISIVTNYSFQ